MATKIVSKFESMSGDLLYIYIKWTEDDIHSD